MKVAVLVVSDTRTAGTNVDETTGPLRTRLEHEGYEVVDTRLVKDEKDAIAAMLRRFSHTLGADLILTSGGTGLGPRDVTPEATRRVLRREAPGIAEMLRAETAREQPKSWLSRGVAGLTDENALVINMPGSPRGVQQYLDVLLPLLPHALGVARGNASH